jgi:RNA recognition motif-containing protein
MQETMNKMVASVRHGVMKPDEASRTIHECAAMLGLELASDIPENTVIVTGMRKNVTKSDLEVAFREFGDIDEAAVASMGRGLGLVRFISTASVKRCMQRFRDKEIVVQDVAIMVKVLKADGVPFNGAEQT